MAWIGTVGGRLKSDLRYAKSIVHNTSSVPSDLSEDARREVIAGGQEILTTRNSHNAVTLSESYEPHSISTNLVRAHAALDRSVDGLYFTGKKINSENDRLIVLFKWFTKLSAALLAGSTS
jgi:hypothetical protein